MEILHRRRRATVEELRAELPDAPSPSSVRKLLEIMIERRLLAREYDGPRHVYFPPLRRGKPVRDPAARQHVLRRLIQFGNCRSARCQRTPALGSRIQASARFAEAGT